jgi:glycosyltransferase involved in cell wall biosynthesis
MPRQKLTFLIPTYNRSALLGRAVASAYAGATGADLDVEVMLVDDHSSDETPEVCARLQQEFATLRVLRQPRNQGLAQARNSGIAAIDADYIALLDDDDLRLNASLMPQIQALRAVPTAAFCYGPVIVADTDLKPTGRLQPADPPHGDIFWALFAENFIRVPSVVLRRSALKENPFTLGFHGVEDYDLWVRLAHDFPVAAVTKPVATYRACDLISGQLSSDAAGMALLTSRLLEQWLELPRARAASRHQRLAARQEFLKHNINLLHHVACRHIELGQAAAARRDLRVAWKLHRKLAAKRGIPRLYLRSFGPRPRTQAPS